jgi:hypothetical protein
MKKNLKNIMNYEKSNIINEKKTISVPDAEKNLVRDIPKHFARSA